MTVRLVQYFVKSVYRGAEYFRGLRWFLLIWLCGGRCLGIPRVGKSVTFKYPPHAGYRIGRACEIGPGSYWDVPAGASVEVGDNVKMTAGVVLSCAQRLRIGSNCLIAEFVSVRDSQHAYMGRDLIRGQGLAVDSIDIGEDVWIGRGSTILGGTTIGDGCVIGANSLVKGGELNRYGVYVGSPVRLIKYRGGLNES